MGNEGSSHARYGETLANDIILERRQIESTSVGAREGHCATSFGNSLFLFGGILSNNGRNEETDQFLNLNLDKWKSIKANGSTPPARAGARLEAVGTKLYLFGGINQQLGWLEEVYMYDTDSNCWSLVETSGNAPSPRDKFASSVIGNKIYIFGGFGPQGMEQEVEVGDDDDEYEDEDDEEEDVGAQFGWFNDLFIFDTETRTWSNPMQMNLGAPTPRAALGMAAVGKHLVLFGGKDAQARKNDLFIFDTEEKKWIQNLDKIVNGRQPEPRSFHTVTAVGHRVVIAGGRGINNQHFDDFHIFDTETKEWLQPKLTGCKPSGRGAHSATVVGDKLVLFGGSSNFNPETGGCDVFYDDTYTVDTAEVLNGKSIPKEIVEDKENLINSTNVPIPSDNLKNQTNSITQPEENSKPLVA